MRKKCYFLLPNNEKIFFNDHCGVYIIHNIISNHIYTFFAVHRSENYYSIRD